MSDSDDIAIEYELIRDATLADIVVQNTEIVPTPADEKQVRIEGRLGLEHDEDDEDSEPSTDVEHYAFAFLFTIGALSFEDARPRGSSGIDYAEKDRWTAGDMLRHLRFEREELRFYADYVRGRCMKTKLIVRADGTFLLETVNRGETATRWIAKLQGERTLSAVSSAPPG